MISTAPPELQNYEFVRELGRGGFAHVYLYRQLLPSRDVAVKVLNRAAETPEDRAQFENEANRMAALSSHPGVVTIYDVGTAPDGRLFLTMEFCPGDHFGRIARQRPLSVSRALEVGVKVAGAVEAAHRAGILHRDIKPANVLMTAHGEPALADFGIAGGRDGHELAESQGMSIHFAAPEVLRGDSAGDELSDVYSLGATVYAFFAGRSPFASTGPDADREVIARVLSGQLPPIGRDDVPSSLHRVLRTAMSSSPAFRFPSAVALGRALQGIEVELGLAPTPLRVADVDLLAADSAWVEDDDGTRFRALRRVDPDGDPVPIRAVPERIEASTPPPALDLPAPAPPETEDTVKPQRAGGAAPAGVTAAPAPAGRERRGVLLASVAGGVVLALVALFVMVGGSGADGDDTSTTTVPPDPDVFVMPEVPLGAVVERLDQDTVQIRWEAETAGERYRVTVVEGPSAGTFTDVDVPELTLDGASGEVCVEIATVIGGRLSDTTDEICGG